MTAHRVLRVTRKVVEVCASKCLCCVACTCPSFNSLESLALAAPKCGDHLRRLGIDLG
jgi:hypothetical protein